MTAPLTRRARPAAAVAAAGLAISLMAALATAQDKRQAIGPKPDDPRTRAQTPAPPAKPAAASSAAQPAAIGPKPDGPRNPPVAAAKTFAAPHVLESKATKAGAGAANSASKDASAAHP